MTNRTTQQNKALHKWLEMKSEQCRDAGVTAQQAFAKTIELELTPEMMKEIWRAVQQSLYGKKSTRDLAKTGEIEDIAEHLNRYFAEQFNLPGIEFPSEEHRSDTLQGLELAKQVEYPENDLEVRF